MVQSDSYFSTGVETWNHQLLVVEMNQNQQKSLSGNSAHDLTLRMVKSSFSPPWKG